ncbi:MAG: methyltransferase domain-containing protein, partial [Planctomycetota bacterium]
GLYLQFGGERTRPSQDLVARIAIQPQNIVDLGCGPGNSTQVLAERWPSASLLGIDNSPAMIDAAKQKYAKQKWGKADIRTWQPESPFDLVFSNAAIQWLPEHEKLIPRLFSWVASKGALAAQIPSAHYATIRVLIHEVSRDARWDERMETPRKALTMERPERIYDLLAPLCQNIDLWETEYIHIMESTSALIEWMKGTGLRPFLQELTNEEGTDFLKILKTRVDQEYEIRADGKVLFPMRRTFFIAYAS